uniref:NADH dehydrogenase subunit 3 n=1 Tax=Argas ricei TaxID=2944766 RepID=UPI0022384DEB|nr:NADH dehydrogenase subunit 3 [Argas ricei]UYB77982.1 NADH dehydrogenase subunit 3 [Argas sp. San Antonio ARK-2022a]UYB77995.1 NADH dehydrogenase subunit 3 [Argas ricei]
MKFLISIFLINFIFLFLSIITKYNKKMNKEKYTPFECGFDPFSISRLPFSLRFFMITIIFLIFDIEIIILLPIPFLSQTPNWNYPLIFIIIIMIILFGLLYEWKKGMIEWLK